MSPSSKNSEAINMYFPFVYHETGLGIKEIDYGINGIFGDVLKVEVNILKKLSKEKTEVNAIEIQDNLFNYYISIINETTNKNIHGISIKDNYIILPFAAAKIGNNLKISLESKSRDSRKCEVNVKIGKSIV